MTLKAEYEGDVTNVPGAYLAVARDVNSGAFKGFYALTDEGTFVRGAGHWITATGTALSQLNGSQLVEMRKTFITIFDNADKKGETPSNEKIAQWSTKGKSGSWDSQQ